MKLALVLMTYSLFMLHEIRAETYTGETSLEEKVLKDANFMGPTQLKEVIAESLSVMGPFEFSNVMVEKNTTIEGPVLNSENGKFDSLNIKGPFTAKNIICKTFKVIGPVDVTHLKVEGDTSIMGSLKANQSQFENMSISADEIFLKDVDVKDIFIKKNMDKKQVLQLKGKTLVKGNIAFESGQGIVELDSAAKVQGEIKGARVEKK